MKKSLLFLVVFVLFAVGIYAGDEPERGPLSLSAGYTYINNPELNGGHINFGIDFFRGKFYLQNNFILRAAGFNLDGVDNTVLTLSEKIVFGSGYLSPNMMIYLYVEGGAGFYANYQNDFSLDTFVYSYGFGGGVEMGRSFYIEAGYIGQKLIADFPLSGFVVQYGWRIYF
ncbi:MAG: hypothetical protein LBI28_00725 [Treponema sp.]|jgi:hypothetical protein|nr:hypothetical protein [Treponema sp.]